MSATSTTPAQGTPTIPAGEQAAYDAGQDARLREHSAQLQAIRAEVAAGQDARIRALRRFVYVGRVVALGAGTTYHYREAGGARGSATSAGAIPAGAVVLRAVTS